MTGPETGGLAIPPICVCTAAHPDQSRAPIDEHRPGQVECHQSYWPGGSCGQDCRPVPPERCWEHRVTSSTETHFVNVTLNLNSSGRIRYTVNSTREITITKLAKPIIMPSTTHASRTDRTFVVSAWPGALLTHSYECASLLVQARESGG
jgi:hypothetical protein